MITFDILTLFPEMLEGVINSSIIKRAIESGKIKVNLINFREFSKNKHQQVDDYAYGGGAGMLISVVPIYDALINIDGYQKAHKIITSPSGRTFNQRLLKNWLNMIILLSFVAIMKELMNVFIIMLMMIFQLVIMS